MLASSQLAVNPNHLQQSPAKKLKSCILPQTCHDTMCFADRQDQPWMILWAVYRWSLRMFDGNDICSLRPFWWFDYWSMFSWYVSSGHVVLMDGWMLGQIISKRLDKSSLGRDDTPFLGKSWEPQNPRDSIWDVQLSVQCLPTTGKTWWKMEVNSHQGKHEEHWLANCWQGGFRSDTIPLLWLTQATEHERWQATGHTSCALNVANLAFDRSRMERWEWQRWLELSE